MRIGEFLRVSQFWSQRDSSLATASNDPRLASCFCSSP